MPKAEYNELINEDIIYTKDVKNILSTYNKINLAQKMQSVIYGPPPYPIKPYYVKVHGKSYHWPYPVHVSISNRYASYDGFIVSTYKEGFGVYTDYTHKYTGQWQTDLVHGQGELVRFLNRQPICRYNGTWKGGLAHGPGEYNDYGADITITGVWKYGLLEGQCNITTPIYSYNGEVENGKCHGHGILTTKTNGEFYKGMFSNGEKNGYGMLISHNETKEGTWENNEMVDGTLIGVMGTYRGTFCNGLFHGQGMLTYGSECLSGIWSEGQFIN